MPNLFRHLTESNSDETLKQVQGDKLVITTQSQNGEREGVRGAAFRGIRRKFSDLTCKNLIRIRGNDGNCRIKERNLLGWSD